MYTGMTACTGEADPMRVLWLVSAEAHVSVGASQNAAADLDLAGCVAQGIPVVRRSLGGGAVWIDSDQPCFFLVLPRRALARGHRHLFSLGMGLAVAVLRQLGLEDVEMRSQDIWVHGRKIMGTGAATLENGCVFGASFLQHFPAERFLACIHEPSEGYRDWILPALREGVTDCEHELALTPDVEAFRAALHTALLQRFGVTPQVETLAPAARDHWIARGREELDEMEQAETRPAVPGGIRINRANHVFETRSRCGRLRLHVTGTRIRRIWCEEPRIDRVLQENVIGLAPERLVLRAGLGSRLDPGLVDEISCRIDALYRGIRNP
ncbi:Lipoate-protein ligase A [Thioalkalivibrio nitratireducens DSM 14787]|uniref:Lipoate-protein ligase A n=1 Tax=Thioalkalivibrio nitratireducens (strain DSM 14787 / UNIQEM 213 / ALEN2) TaxID=1255043 RepID=L0E0S1_THIND|nr:Lipoate-protein ligase A [Thioalkalivibrio nitratireducens DSM 14787]